MIAEASPSSLTPVVPPTVVIVSEAEAPVLTSMPVVTPEMAELLWIVTLLFASTSTPVPPPLTEAPERTSLAPEI